MYPLETRFARIVLFSMIVVRVWWHNVQTKLAGQQELLSWFFFDHVSSNIRRLWLLLCYLRVFFINLRHLRDFTSHIPKGNLVYVYKNVCFWPFGVFSLFRPRFFPRALGSVACREPARTPHASLGPGRGPWQQVAHALREGFREGFRARRAINASGNPRTG